MTRTIIEGTGPIRMSVSVSGLSSAVQIGVESPEMAMQLKEGQTWIPYSEAGLYAHLEPEGLRTLIDAIYEVADPPGEDSLELNGHKRSFANGYFAAVTDLGANAREASVGARGLCGPEYMPSASDPVSDLCGRVGTPESCAPGCCQAPGAVPKSILFAADELINGQRQADYGTPLRNFSRIADLWNAYIANMPDNLCGAPPVGLEAEDVAMLLGLLKVARFQVGQSEDSLIDIAGYAGCVELIQRERDELTDGVLVSGGRHRKP